MLKKGMALLGALSLGLLFNLFFGVIPANSITPSDNGCFIFKDKPTVCPDKYCMPGTASCSQDGFRCYCKPRILANTSKNQACEIIFGSKMTFRVENGEPVVYLYGGIWSQIADQIPNSLYVGDINNDKGVIFRKTQNRGGRVYTSRFLTDLAAVLKKPTTAIPGQIGISIEADIDVDSGIGKVSNPRYVTITNIGQKTKTQSCGHLKHGGDHFFLKYSPLDPIAKGRYGNTCTEPSEVLKLFIFGANKDGFFEKKPKVDLTKNCTDKKDSIFSEDNIDMHLLMANLIVPQDQERRIYMDKSDNFLFGEIFDGTNTQQKLNRIAEKCKTKCKTANPIDECKYCNSQITASLKANPKKTLNDIIVDGLVSDNDAVCDLVNTSLDNIEGKTTGQKRHSRLLPFLPSEDQPDQKTSEEMKLDEQLPIGLIRLCDAQRLTANQRLKCKQNAVDCYAKNLPEIEPADMCNQLTGELETTRWLICPMSNTLSGAADKSVQQLEKFFKLETSSIFDNPIFQQAWRSFRNISNVFLILVMMWVIAAQVTGYGLSNYNIKKILPKLLVAILLINFSLIIAKIAVDLSNIAGVGFFNLFRGLSNHISSISGANLSASNIALGILSGKSLVILSGLAILFPSMLILLFGLIFVILVLSLRHALIVLLVLLMPVAIIAGIIPNLNQFFQKWIKNFTSVILIFPVIGFLYGSGIFLRALLVAVAQDNNLIKLVGFAMPVISTLATPAVLMAVTRSVNGLSGALNKTTSDARNFAKGQIKQTAINQAWNANLKDLGGRISNSRLAKRFYGSSALNTVFSGAGTSILKQNEARQWASKKNFDSIVGTDTKLLKAFHESGGNVNSSEYKQLNSGQQQKFKQLSNLGAIKDPTFYTSSLQTLASKGGVSADGREVKQIIENARKAGIEDKIIESELKVSSKIAEKAGNPLTSGVLSHAATNLGSTGSTSPLKGFVETAFDKTRPANFKVEDFKDEKSPAIAILRQKIQFKPQDTITSLNGHYLAAIGQDYDQIPLEIRSKIDLDIINSVNQFRDYKNLEKINFQSAQDALMSVDLLKTRGGAL